MFIIRPYDTYINQFYKKNSGLNKKSYVTQKKAIDQDCFAWCGVWDKPFEKLGFKTMSVYPNCRDLQQTWALENINKNLDISLILEKQISFFKPDILMTDDISFYDDNWIINLKIKFPFIKKIIGHICSSIYSPEKIKKYDYILTCLESIKSKIIKHNKNVFIVPLAFNIRILEKVKSKHHQLNKIIFYGSILRGKKDLHGYREKLLIYLVNNKTNIDLFSEAYDYNNFKIILYSLIKMNIYLLINLLIKIPFLKEIILNTSFYSKTIFWGNIKLNYFSKDLKRNLKKPLYGIDLFNKLSNYVASLNVHGDVVGNEAANLRLFEVTGLGCCLLTDHKLNNDKFFNSNEILEYKNFEECNEKIKWIMKNPEKSKEMGLAAQKNVLKNHTYFNRAKLILDFIKDE